MKTFNFEHFWQQLVESNPALGNDEQRLTMASRELKRLCELAYKAGKAIEPTAQRKDSREWLSELFGGGLLK